MENLSKMKTRKQLRDEYLKFEDELRRVNELAPKYVEEYFVRYEKRDLEEVGIGWVYYPEYDYFAIRKPEKSPKNFTPEEARKMGLWLVQMTCEDEVSL